MQRFRSSLRGQGKWVLLSSIVLGLLIAPFAVAGDGDVMRVGDGNSAGINEPRIFVNALRTALAVDFRSHGNLGGRILVYGDKANPRNNKPITTNATGVA